MSEAVKERGAVKEDVQTAPRNSFLGEVQEHAEKIKNDEPHVVETMSVGDFWPQGDIGIVFLGDCEGPGKADFSKLDEIKKDSPLYTEQLAPGNTQGSRHCIADLESVTLYRARNSTELDGPRIDAPKGVRVNHPEHGDVTLPCGRYGIIYQQVWESFERRSRRALD